MNKYWVSWYSPEELMGKFELHSPWWVSGSDMGSRDTICAAIKAHTEKEAKQIVRECYDDCPPPIEWRFVEEREKDWSPFNGRFRKSDWMKWED